MRAGKGTGTLEQPPRERQGREPRREGEGKTRGLGEHPDRRAKRSYIAYMFHEIFIWVLVLILLLVRINNRCITVHHDYDFGARDARPKRTLIFPSASGAQPVPLSASSQVFGRHWIAWVPMQVGADGESCILGLRHFYLRRYRRVCTDVHRLALAHAHIVVKHVERLK
jgi:hypothetical protein